MQSDIPRSVFPVSKPPLLDSAACACVVSSLRPVDAEATPKTSKLLQFLYERAKSPSVLFGQQNAGHIGISIRRTDGTESDVKRVCGSHPAVVGIDTLSLVGYEGTWEQAVTVTKNLRREKAIITLSMHAPNFAVCDENFAGYLAPVTEPPVVNEILPGGAFHAKYLRYLDRIASYAAACTEDDGEPIPMIFRPFHENNGSWFWWGADFCTPNEYKDLFRYTVHYLKNEKGIHQFLYAYSPNGPFVDEADYLSRYPGDDFVDLIGFDMYHDRPQVGDTWMDTLLQTCRTVAAVARDRHKVAAVTEAGIRMLDTATDGKSYEGLCPYNNPRPNWFTECYDAILSDPLASEIAYFLTWANFGPSQFWTPYIVDERAGHEMINEFTSFLNDPRVILASQLPS